MRYWVIKGRPDVNKWDELLMPGTEHGWETQKPLKTWSQGDRIFCWESGPRRRMIGLAELIEPNGGKKGRTNFFTVKYITHRLSYMPPIGELKHIPVLESADFLMPGPPNTVYDLSRGQAETLFLHLYAKNSELHELNIWPDIQAVPSGFSPNHLTTDLDRPSSVLEGGQNLVSHFRRERNRAIVAKKRAEVLQKTGQLKCEACGFDFKRTYGAIGEGFCEIHHLLPLSEAETNEVETQLEDLAVVCSNCHRMIHRYSSLLKICELRAMVQMAPLSSRSVTSNE